MRIAQISDIHLSSENLYEFKAYYLEQLKIDLKKFHDDRPFDLLILTGDLLDKGGLSFHDITEIYEFFENEFINPIVSYLNLEKNKVLFIPGNHDIQLAEIDEIHEIGLTAKILSIAEANKKLDESKHSFSLINNRIRKFKEFEKKFHHLTKDYIYSNNESLFSFEENGFRIGILLINDSWRSSITLDKSHHFIGINQLLNAKQYFSEIKTDLNIALFHHPLELLNREEETEIKNILQRFDFELVLYGHTHKHDISNSFGVVGNVVFIGARSAFNNPREKLSEYEPGYNIIDIDASTLSLTCFFRKYIHNRFEFDKDTNSSPDGIYETTLTAKGQKKNFYELYTLATRTVGSHLEDFNNSLLMFKTNTIAPKSIEDIFVLPKLTNKPSTYSNKSDRTYSIYEIVSEKKPVLLFGNKESGKTTLLSKHPTSTVSPQLFGFVILFLCFPIVW